jgi:hypothetical protein
VIDSNEPENWTFVDCTVLSTGRRPFEEWYQKKLSDGGRFTLDGLLKTIHKTKNHLEWMGFRGFLKGKAAEYRIWELGFKADGRQYRVFGMFGAVRKRAILLGGCYHKMVVYSPPNAISSACKVAREIKAGRVIWNERKIKTDL